jgi:hypothetical protein
MRDQRLELYELPDYRSRKNKSNDYGFDPHEQATATYTGMGADINVHDQWAVESMGPIQDRTREYLGQSDKAIVQYRRLLRQEIEKVASGAKPFMFLDAAHARSIQGPRHHGRHRPDQGMGNLLDGGRCEAAPRRAMGRTCSGRDRRQGSPSFGGRVMAFLEHGGLELNRRRHSGHLAPLAGRGRSRRLRVRGTIHELNRWRVPLTPTLSPQAGRGRSGPLRFNLNSSDSSRRLRE